MHHGGAWESAKLQGAKLNGAKLQGAELNSAKLQGASLKYAQLQGASLDYAGLQGAELNGAKLQGASLEYAGLQGASLQRAVLEATDLSDALLWRSNSGDGASVAAVRLPDSPDQWRPDAYQDLRKLMDSPPSGVFPSGALSDQALHRIRRLDCANPDPTLAPCNPSVSPPPEAAAWRTALEGARADRSSYAKALCGAKGVSLLGRRRRGLCFARHSSLGAH